jgi:hypothetical protein
MVTKARASDAPLGRSDAPPAPSSGVVPRTSRSPRVVADLLGDLAALEQPATGALIVGSAEGLRGILVLDQGRLCWAATRSVGARLLELVAQTASVSDAQARIDAVLSALLKERLPLGESLLKRGVVTSDAMNAAFKRQTVETILGLAARGARPLGWIPRASLPAAVDFSFTLSEMLVACNAAMASEAVKAATTQLEEMLDEGTAAISFALDRSEHNASPIFVRGDLKLDLEQLSALGCFAVEALASARELAMEPGGQYVSATLDGATSVVVFRRGMLAHLAICDGADSASSVMMRLEGFEREHGQGPASFR